MMDKLKDLLVVMMVSALIGAVVGGAFQLIIGLGLLRGLLSGAAAGIMIGLVSNYAFVLVYLKLGQHPLWAGLAVSAVIALGTAGFALVFRVPLPWPGAAMISVSVLAGLAATAVIFHRAARLNKMLEEKKRTLAG